MRSGPTALRTAQRNLLPLPAIAAAAVKFGGAAMLKKVALSKVIQKVGPDKVLGELKTLNGRLRSSGGRYGADVADAAEDSLSALERSLTTLRGDERVGALWGWYSRLEKDNPTLAAAILKSWMETLPGAKWASALMPGHLRRARLLANLKERLQADADERAALGDPLPLRARRHHLLGRPRCHPDHHGG